MIAVVAVVAMAGVVVAVHRLRGKRQAEARTATEAGLGFTVDLITVVVGSGGTIGQAVETVARHGPDLVAPTFRRVMERARTDLLLADALDVAVDDLGPTFHPLIGALVATERDGAPISLLLQHLADDAQQARQWQAEALAKRLPVTMLVPLATCLLPATIIGALVPLVLVALRQLDL